MDFDTSRLFKPLIEPEPYAHEIVYTDQALFVSFGQCHLQMVHILNFTNHDLRRFFWHNAIIRALLGPQGKSVCAPLIGCKHVELTLEMCCALVFVASSHIVHVPTTFHDNEMLEEALFKSKRRDYLMRNYIYNFHPGRPKCFLKEIVDTCLPYSIGPNALQCLMPEEHTHCIEKRICAINPFNVRFSLFLSADEVMDFIESDKRVVFAIPKHMWTVPLVCDVLKQVGSFLFSNPAYCRRGLFGMYTNGACPVIAPPRFSLDVFNVEQLTELKEWVRQNQHWIGTERSVNKIQNKIYSAVCKKGREK